MEKLNNNQEQEVLKNRNDKFLKNAQEEFKEFKKYVQKLSTYTKITNDLLLDAYALAKAIQEKYKYKMDSVSILEDVGVEVDKQEGKNKGDDYCQIIFGENERAKVTINYNIVSKAIERNTMYDTVKAHNTDYTTDHNNAIFLCKYALVVIIMLCNDFSIDVSKKLYYEKNSYRPTISEKIVRIIVNFMFYVEDDYYVRVDCYPYGSMILENEKPNGKMREIDFMYKQQFEQTAMLHYMAIGKTYECEEYVFNPRDRRSNYTLEDIIKCIIRLKKRCKKEYASLSEMDAPEELYLKYKNKNYDDFGRTKKIDF